MLLLLQFITAIAATGYNFSLTIVDFSGSIDGIRFSCEGNTDPSQCDHIYFSLFCWLSQIQGPPTRTQTCPICVVLEETPVDHTNYGLIKLSYFTSEAWKV